MLAVTRERRSKAGNRLAELLDDEDDFYKSAYGGFEEDEDDDEFSVKSEEEHQQTDSCDSDFSTAEADVSSGEEEEKEEESGKRKARKYVVPQKRPAKPAPEKSAKKKNTSISSASKKGADNTNIERKTVRHSTSLKSAQTTQRLQELKAKKQSKDQSKKMMERYEMTQEELLEEAKQTEIINLKSLEMYEKIELEKRERAKASRQKTDVPMIRLHSLAMPCIDHALVDEKTGEITGAKLGLHERTFITFPDQETMDKYFPKKKAPPPPKPKLTSNGEPARYFDPVTKVAYNTVAEYRLLRFAYCTYLDRKGNPKDPEIAAFQKWYRQQGSTLQKTGKSS